MSEISMFQIPNASCQTANDFDAMTIYEELSKIAEEIAQCRAKKLSA
jgi:hypothetical protein